MAPGSPMFQIAQKIVKVGGDVLKFNVISAIRRVVARSENQAIIAVFMIAAISGFLYFNDNHVQRVQRERERQRVVMPMSKMVRFALSLRPSERNAENLNKDASLAPAALHESRFFSKNLEAIAKISHLDENSLVMTVGPLDEEACGWVFHYMQEWWAPPKEWALPAAKVEAAGSEGVRAFSEVKDFKQGFAQACHLGREVVVTLTWKTVDAIAAK